MTRSQHLALRVVAVSTTIVIATPFMLAMALMGESDGKIQSASTVVLQLDTLAMKGDWETAHQLFAYRYKGRTILPDMWSAADDEARDSFIALWKPQFRQGWERTRGSTEWRDKDWVLSEERLSPQRILVEQRPAQHSAALTIRYWLIRQGDRWMIADRTYVIDGLEHSGTKVVQRIRQKVQQQLGHSPSLEEFVANAPSWIGRLRMKTYRIP